MSILSKNKEIDLFSVNCRFQSIYDILFQYDIPINMDYITILSTDYFINAAMLNNVNKIDLLFFSAFNPFFDINLLESLGFECIEQNPSVNDSLEKILGFCDNNELVLYYFDSAILSDKYNSNTFKFNLLSTGIALSGDLTKRMITLNSLASKNSTVEVDYDKFAQSRSSNIYPFPPNEKSYLIKPLHKIESLDLNQKVLEHLKFMGKNYFETNCLKLTTQFTIHQGNVAYDICHDYLIKLKQQLLKYESFDSKTADLWFGIVMKVLRRSLICSTATFHRKELATSILNVNKVIKDSGIHDAAIQMNKVSSYWRKLVRMTYFYYKSIHEKEVYLNEIIDLIEVIKESENKIMENFMSINI